MSDQTSVLTSEVTPETPAVEAAPVAPVAEAVTENVGEKVWRDILPEELKNDPSIIKYASIEDLAKGHQHLMKTIGSDKISIPDKHATPDDWKALFNRLGNPEKLEEYDVKVNDESGLDGDFVDWYKQTAHELGVLPHQAQDLINKFVDRNTEFANGMKAEMETSLNETVSSLKQEWGQAFDHKVNAAQRAVKEIGGEELAKALDRTGAGNDPAVIKTFARVAEFLKEDSEVTGGKTSTVMTPGDALQRARTIMTDKTHPFNDSSHPNYKAAQKEVGQLYEVAYPVE
jgi:hypothetical protein